MSTAAPDVFSPCRMYSPTIASFEKDESLSLSGTRAFASFLLSQGVDGLVPLGGAEDPPCAHDQMKLFKFRQET